MDIIFFAMSGLINCMLAIISGAIILFYDLKNKVNRVYFLFAGAIAFWSFSYWIWLISDNPESALFWAKIMGISTIIIPVVYFHLIVEILGEGESKKFLVGSAYMVLAVVAIFSPLDFFVEGVTQRMFFPYWPIPGPLYHFVFGLIYTPLVAYSFVLLAHNYQNSKGSKKTQMLFLLIGSILGWLGGFTNFFLFYNLPVPPYGNFIIPLYTLFVGYSIMKNRFFQAKVVAAEIFIFSIWIFLILRTNFSSDYKDFLINISVLTGAVIISFFLIYSIMSGEKYREKIVEAYEVEKRARQELVELDKVKNQFIIITQHHLRTPLGAIRGYASAILEGVYGRVPPPLEDPVKRVEISAGRLLSVADEFLAISQLQVGKEITILKPGVKIIPIIEEAIEEVKFEADKRKLYIHFKIEKECDNAEISADSQLLKSALLNFFDNAVRYTDEGGVDITLKKNADKLKITIKDTGIGMTEKEIEDSMVKLFQRGERAKEMYVVGRGIGLYLSDRIIKAHGGGVFAESEGLNMGSTFTVELPWI